MNGPQSSVNAVVAFSIAATIIKLALTRRRIMKGSHTIVKEKLMLPAEVSFLDQDSFSVLALLCDAFIPSLSADQCSTDAIKETLDAMHPSLRDESDLLFADTARIKAFQQYLQRGSLEMDIHLMTAQALQKLTTPSEKQQLYLLLKVLSTSIGCFLVTGSPAAVQDMSLDSRVHLLCGFRDSPLVPLRAFYQTVKRVTCNLFFSYVEHGGKNPAWESLSYDPFETVSKQPAVAAAAAAAAAPSSPSEGSSTPSQEQLDHLLREKITYQSVRSELNQRGFVEEANGADVIEADVVVVGSGSGGGMIASELAKAGLRVVVLEKGGYFRAAEFKKWRECEAMLHSFEKGGLCTSSSGSVLVLAGACVGGGSTINWSASFRTPQCVQEDWVHKRGLKEFERGGPFDHSLDEVHRLMSINVDNSYRTVDEPGAFAMNENNRLLWTGAERVGYIPEKIPRNVKSCVDCGHCCYGCPYESKQSTLTALLEPKLKQMHLPRSGAPADTRYDLHIIPHCTAHRIIYETCDAAGNKSVRGADKEFVCKKTAVGVEATVAMHTRSLAGLSVQERLQYLHEVMNTPSHPEVVTRKIIVRAKVVVSAGGSLHTPALLLRSQLRGQHGNGGSGRVGANLTLHPVLGVGGLFDKATETGLNTGVSMGVVIREPPIFAGCSSTPQVQKASSDSGERDYDDDFYYRVAPETPPIHAGLMGLMSPWTTGGLGLKLGVLGWRNSATFIGISRDRSCAANCITIDKEGNPVINYDVTKADAAMLMAGLEANLRMMRAAGAKFLYVAHESFKWHYTGGGDRAEEAKRFEAYLAALRREGVKPISMQVFSAHQMSSCRMAATPQEGPVSPSGELYECSNLYVADGSLLPTSLGINPMIVIESLAHMVAKNVVKRITSMDAETKSKVDRFVAHHREGRCDW